MWVLANTFGFLFALPVVLLITGPLIYLISLIFPNIFDCLNTLFGEVVYSSIQILIFAIVVGFLQWTIIGSKRIPIRLWLAVNCPGWVISLLPVIIYISHSFPLEKIWVWLILYGIWTGSIVGISQWLLMRKINRLSFLWIPVNIIGHIIAIIIISSILFTLAPFAEEGDMSLALLIVVPLFGIITSIVSGLALIWPIKWFEASGIKS